MAASIDATAAVVTAADLELMKLRADGRYTVGDIADKAGRALGLDGRYAQALRQLAVARYDWRGVAQTLARHLRPT